MIGAVLVDETRMGKLPVEYICFLNRSGYSQAAQDLIWAMRASGGFDLRVRTCHRYACEPSISREREKVVAEMLAAPERRDAVQFYHCVPTFQYRFRPLPKSVGFATFETFDPPKQWVDVLNKNAAVVCPSEFNVRVFRDAGVSRPIFHLPHCVDTAAFNSSVSHRPFEKHAKFTFLFFGAWRLRKGWPQLIEAYFREFTPADKVRLLIRTDNYERAVKDVERLRREVGLSEKESPPVLFETRVIDELKLPSFLKTADCLVFPTLGEGFGLPPLQCMALGVPVIVTNFSGVQDYASERTATLLEPDGFLSHPCLDQFTQFAMKKWAHVPVSSIREAMRYARENADEIRVKAGVAANEVAEKFSYAKAVEKLRPVLDYVNAG